MDYLTHIRMECVRLVMEGLEPSTVLEAVTDAESLVDYIRSGHIAGNTVKSSGRSTGTH